jgi:hypothetical protein
MVMKLNVFCSTVQVHTACGEEAEKAGDLPKSIGCYESVYPDPFCIHLHIQCLEWKLQKMM